MAKLAALEDTNVSVQTENHRRLAASTGELVLEYTRDVNCRTYTKYKSAVIQSNGHTPTEYTIFSQSAVPAEKRVTENVVGNYILIDENIHCFMPDNCALLTSAGGQTQGTLRVNNNVVNRALTECLANLNNRPVDFGNSLGEVRETARTISKTAREGVNFLLAVKRGDTRALRRFLNPRTVPDRLADRWLEYNYAFKPLASDIYGAVNLHNEGLKSSPDGFFQTRRTIRDKPTYSYNDGYFVFTSKADVTYRATIRCRINKSHIRAMTLLGLDDPLRIAWELTPFSFVVDWMLPIGNYLEARNVQTQIELEHGYVSIKGTCEGEAVFGGDGDICYPNTCVNYNPSKYSASGFTRVVTTGGSLAAPYYKSPLSMHHGITTAALIKKLL